MSTSRDSADDRASRVSGDTAESAGALSDAGRKRRLLSEAQEAEVREQRDTSTQTRRVTAPGLEEILYEPLPERLLASDQCLGNRWMRMDNMGTQCKAVVLKRVGNLKQ